MGFFIWRSELGSSIIVFMNNFGHILGFTEFFNFKDRKRRKKSAETIIKVQALYSKLDGPRRAYAPPVEVPGGRGFQGVSP